MEFRSFMHIFGSPINLVLLKSYSAVEHYYSLQLFTEKRKSKVGKKEDENV